VEVQANLPSAVHLGRFAVEFRELQLDGNGGVPCWDFELKLELVFQQVVDVPTMPGPLRAVLIGLDLEPIVVLLLVHLDVCDQ